MDPASKGVGLITSLFEAAAGVVELTGITSKKRAPCASKEKMRMEDVESSYPEFAELLKNYAQGDEKFTQKAWKASFQHKVWMDWFDQFSDLFKEIMDQMMSSTKLLALIVGILMGIKMIAPL